MKGTWQTSSSGGSVAATLVGGGLVIFAAAALANALPHVLTAGGNFLRALAQLILAITVAIIALGVTAYFGHRAYRKHHPVQPPPFISTFRARVIPPSTGPAVDPPPAALPAAQPGGLHVHFHNVDPAQAAAILRDAQDTP